MNKIPLDNIEPLLEYLALFGGRIVSTASLLPEWREQALASGRMYVDQNSLGYVWEPDIKEFPETPEEVEWFERWYPLDINLPLDLKIPFFFNQRQNIKELK